MARTSKSRGSAPFQMRSGNKSPYKFLGKVGKALGGAVGAASSLFGGGNNVAGGGMPAAAIMGGPMGMAAHKLMANPGVNAPASLAKRSALGKKSAYKKASPYKTDAILVRGTYDAASGKGTTKYGMIAPARAWSDMADTVERTVNRSSAAQLAKDRRRSKRTVRSHDRYADWRERYERREHERERHQSKRRAARNKYRQEVWGKPPVPDYDFDRYDDEGMLRGDYGYYW
tara:strand:+ start:16485 stop:17174 length:690 start_codon:yes stop_codon:yes gene_type:complete